MSPASNRRTAATQTALRGVCGVPQRRRIIDAMRACAVRSGLRAGSMDQVAAEAGISVGQIYRYFPNKAALLATVIAECLSDSELHFFHWLLNEDEDDFLPVRDEAGPAFDASLLNLVMQIHAEAARDLEVAAHVRAYQDRRRRLGSALLQLRRPDHDAAALEPHVNALCLAFDGMMVGYALRGQTSWPGSNRMLSRVIDALPALPFATSCAPLRSSAA